MKAYALEKLLRTREHREQRALQVVAQDRAALAARVAEMQAVERRLAELTEEEDRLAARLAEGMLRGVCAIEELSSIDSRRALLRDRRAALDVELARASESVEEARRKLAESVQAYRHARAKKDSAGMQRDRWRSHERSLMDRRDENASDELTLSRYIATERSL